MFTYCSTLDEFSGHFQFIFLLMTKSLLKCVGKFIKCRKYSKMLRIHKIKLSAWVIFNRERQRRNQTYISAKYICHCSQNTKDTLVLVYTIIYIHIFCYLIYYVCVCEYMYVKTAMMKECRKKKNLKILQINVTETRCIVNAKNMHRARLDIVEQNIASKMTSSLPLLPLQKLYIY